MEVLRTAILDLLRRKTAGTFSSSDVVRQMYPEDWEQFLDEVNSVAIALSNEGLISITTDGDKNPDSLKISSPNKL